MDKLKSHSSWENVSFNNASNEEDLDDRNIGRQVCGEPYDVIGSGPTHHFKYKFSHIKYIILDKINIQWRLSHHLGINSTLWDCYLLLNNLPYIRF